MTRPAFHVGLVASLLTGAGVYGQWVADPSIEYAGWLLVGGLACYGVAYWLGTSNVVPVRVGDAGVALESGELQRVLWCDLQRLSVVGSQLMVKSAEFTLAIPIGPQSKAVARIVAEATKRVPDVVAIKREVMDALPKPSSDDGESVPVDGFPVVGRECAASDEPITFERDARICPNCSQVYLKTKVPAKCASCERPLGALARSIGD